MFYRSPNADGLTLGCLILNLLVCIHDQRLSTFPCEPKSCDFYVSWCGPLQHGFARNCSWEVVATSNEDDTPCVTLRLVDNEYSRAMWNFKFVVKYSVFSHLNLMFVNSGVEAFILYP